MTDEPCELYKEAYSVQTSERMADDPKPVLYMDINHISFILKQQHKLLSSSQHALYARHLLLTEPITMLLFLCCSSGN